MAARTNTKVEGTTPDATTTEPVTPAAEQTEPQGTVDAGPVTATATTTLDSDTTKPSETAPGDGPADTTDPREIASSAPVNPGPEALAAGTVNAVQKVGMIPAAPERDESADRIEQYQSERPDGTKVTVRHNLETGATEVTPLDAE